MLLLKVTNGREHSSSSYHNEILYYIFFLQVSRIAYRISINSIKLPNPKIPYIIPSKKKNPIPSAHRSNVRREELEMSVMPI